LLKLAKVDFEQMWSAKIAIRRRYNCAEK
jgi:hypothetical protein